MAYVIIDQSHKDTAKIMSNQQVYFLELEVLNTLAKLLTCSIATNTSASSTATTTTRITIGTTTNQAR